VRARIVDMSFTIILAVLGGVLLAIIASVAIQRRRERRTATWPWAKINLDSGEIEHANNSGGGSTWNLLVGYSYTVEGCGYSGTYTCEFASKSEAEDLLKSLRELPPPTRYQPGKPEVSVLDPYRDAGLGL